MESQIDIYTNITLFVWVGTCNLTKKTTDGYIEITSKDNSAAYTLIETLKQVYHFVRQFGSSVKLVFIQVPIYSITHYNKYKNHQNPDTFTEQDFLLRQQIDIVNQYIDDTNRILHSYSPVLSTGGGQGCLGRKVERAAKDLGAGSGAAQERSW